MRPVVVAGGGIAGSVAACLLARAGHSVLVIERERQPKHKVCGEFLSCEALIYLADLGVDVMALGAVPITHLRLARAEDMATCRLPFTGKSLSRQSLDEALLRHAECLGADVRRGHVIRKITSGDGLRLSVDGLGVVAPATLFLASGKYDVRGAERQASRPSNGLVGLKSYFRLMPRQEDELRSHVEIFLFRGGYAGLQMVEYNRANLCLLVSRKRFAASKNDWQGLLSDLVTENAHLRARLSGAAELLERPLAVAGIPYGFVHRPALDEPGALFRLGDQFAVTPSFSGDGMSIAFHTAFAAVDAFLAGHNADEYHRRMCREISPQIWRAGLLSAGMLHNSGQASIMIFARAMPWLLRGAATITRIRKPSIANYLSSL